MRDSPKCQRDLFNLPGIRIRPGRIIISAPPAAIELAIMSINRNGIASQALLQPIPDSNCIQHPFYRTEFCVLNLPSYEINPDSHDVHVSSRSGHVQNAGVHVRTGIAHVQQPWGHVRNLSEHPPPLRGLYRVSWDMFSSVLHMFSNGLRIPKPFRELSNATCRTLHRRWTCFATIGTCFPGR